MDIENMSIEEATERCKALTNPEQGCWIGRSNQKAIETVLNELKKRDEIIKTLQEIKKEALLDDLGKQYNIYKHVDLSKCLHCGENIPHYCEKCYQQLISDISKYQGG